MGVLTVAIFSVLLAIIPLLFFSLVRREAFDDVLSTVFGSAFLNSNRVVLGGVLSVVLVNVILFLFVFVAFVLEKPQPKRRKRLGDPTFGKERAPEKDLTKKEKKENKKEK